MAGANKVDGASCISRAHCKPTVSDIPVSMIRLFATVQGSKQYPPVLYCPVRVNMAANTMLRVPRFTAHYLKTAGGHRVNHRQPRGATIGTTGWRLGTWLLPRIAIAIWKSTHNQSGEIGKPRWEILWIMHGCYEYSATILLVRTSNSYYAFTGATVEPGSDILPRQTQKCGPKQPISWNLDEHRPPVTMHGGHLRGLCERYLLVAK